MIAPAILRESAYGWNLHRIDSDSEAEGRAKLRDVLPETERKPNDTSSAALARLQNGWASSSPRKDDMLTMLPGNSSTAPAEVLPGAESEPGGSLPELLGQFLHRAILAIDEHRQVTAFSEDSAALLGVSVEKALGHSMDVLPGPLREVLRKTLSNGEPIRDAKILVVGGGGVAITLRLSTTPCWSGGSPRRCTGVIATLSNMAPANEFDTNLRRIDRLASVGTLSASMAHEVKNAMVAVKTFVDLLIKQNQNAELAPIVEREMRRIDSIVTQMLRFSGPARPTFAEVHLHEILEQSLCLVQHHLEGRKIQLTRSFKADPDTLRGDSYQLEQAFLNLFFNAIEAMGTTGELKVTTELVPSDKEGPRAPLLKVQVQDTGGGIAAPDMERLFEPFFTTKANGTGLGLPITRRIVQEHRGSIVAQSEVHRGTTFTLLLPLVAKQP